MFPLLSRTRDSGAGKRSKGGAHQRRTVLVLKRSSYLPRRTYSTERPAIRGLSSSWYFEVARLNSRTKQSTHSTRQNRC